MQGPAAASNRQPTRTKYDPIGVTYAAGGGAMPTAMTREPRVYWLTEEFPPEFGGTGLVAASLSTGLVARHFVVHVITRQIVPPAATDELYGTVRLRRIRPAGRMKGIGWRAFPLMVAYLAHLALILIRESRRYDVVIVSCMKIIPLAAIPICLVLGKRCVIRLESPFEIAEPIAAESLSEMNDFLGRTLARMLSKIQRQLLRRADRVVAISKDIEQLLRDSGVSSKRIAGIPNAIDLGRFRPVSASERAHLREKLQMPPDEVVALYAGRLSRAKGVSMLVEEWPRILCADTKVKLMLVGSGKGSWDDCEEYLAEFIRSHGLEDHVRLAGQSDCVHEYMQAADLFISPSEYEGFGLAVVEALACGLPCVVTSVGIAPEIIVHGTNGFLFPPKNSQALMEAIGTAVARREDWSEISQRARDSVRRFDRSAIVEQYAALCRELCA